MDSKWLISDGQKRGIWVPRILELSQEAEADILLAYRIAEKRAEAEISGIGLVQERDDYSFLVSEILIPRQTCTGGDTRILGTVMRTALEEIEERGGSPLSFNFWWHSHVDGRAWFSSIDDDMILDRLHVMMTTVHARMLKDDGEVSDEAIAGPFLSLVGNIRGEMTVRCDFLHRRGDQYSQHMSVIPVLGGLAALSPEERRAFLKVRSEEIEKQVDERVSFKSRLSDLLRERGLRRISPNDSHEENDGE